MTLINSANVMQTEELEGVQQDCWIATRDKKLFQFSKILYYLDLDGEAGKFAVSTILPEHSSDEYWQQATHEQRSLGLSRMRDHLVREIDVLSYPDIAKVAMSEVARVFHET